MSIYEFIDVFPQEMSEERTGMDLLLSVINDLVTHNLYNLSTITFCFYLHQFSAKFIFMSGS